MIQARTIVKKAALGLAFLMSLSGCDPLGSESSLTASNGSTVHITTTADTIQCSKIPQDAQCIAQAKTVPGLEAQKAALLKKLAPLQAQFDAIPVPWLTSCDAHNAGVCQKMRDDYQAELKVYRAKVAPLLALIRPLKEQIAEIDRQIEATRSVTRYNVGLDTRAQNTNACDFTLQCTRFSQDAEFLAVPPGLTPGTTEYTTWLTTKVEDYACRKFKCLLDKDVADSIIHSTDGNMAAIQEVINQHIQNSIANGNGYYQCTLQYNYMTHSYECI